MLIWSSCTQLLLEARTIIIMKEASNMQAYIEGKLQSTLRLPPEVFFSKSNFLPLCVLSCPSLSLNATTIQTGKFIVGFCRPQKKRPCNKFKRIIMEHSIQTRRNHSTKRETSFRTTFIRLADNLT